ncbi:LRR receptor-like serine/threonine-protein kinase EFR [Actinidia eriantha]|uniref:LRR receptor-like serine/threonine-protein kinase EFR n=1 Tax=Actinidia eriantha TaxID=165200 RepID=UPI00259004AA|nr:LRR receptor-like serine/threonine-protein kinase EFR [Actinidia eriantha]
MVIHFFIASLSRLLLASTFMTWVSASSPTNFTDQSALLSFKSHLALNPNHPLTDNWTTTTSFCEWVGVSCSRRRQRVTTLNLSFMGIQGRVSPYIGNLSFLTILNLRNNSLRGDLPETLGRLHRLKVMDLTYNHLEGTIPSSLSMCQDLQSVLLGSNQLQGNIPIEIGNLLHLEVLLLRENYLTGTIPLTVFNVSTLRVIDIRQNNISGGIPNTICRKLSRLELLYLSFNPLEGPFPSSLCQCGSLSKLYLFQNFFSGSIPDDIGCLSNLEDLFLGRNLLTGTIPPSIGNLSRLLRLDFIDNYMVGGIPPELTQLSQIRYLRIAFNKLSGRIPPIIFNLSSAETINFMNNSLTGNIPEMPDLLLPNLRYLHLQGNRLNGIIPNCLSNASKLVILELSKNSFSGPVPNSLGNLRFLDTLNLRLNQLSNHPSQTELHFLTSLTRCRGLRNLVIGLNRFNGVLPSSIGNLSTSLELFSADMSQLKGSIPLSIGNLSNLRTLEMAANNLIGMVPSSVGNIDRLQRLRLFRNNIEGSIPNELCRLTFLGELLLHENKLSGPIPSCIGNLSIMQAIDLSSNALTSIPLGMWSLTDIWYMNLSKNSFVGYLPLDIEKLVGLQYFHLSRNQLSGSIPNTISNLKMLKELDFSNNSLNGTIPEVTADLASLELLDLSLNKLSGIIPKVLEKLQYLKYLNLSFNMLSGEVPSGGPFGNFTAPSFMGNNELCGAPKFQLPTCRNDPHQNPRKLIHLLKCILPPFASIIILTVLLIVLFQYRKKKREVPSHIESSAGAVHQLISYNELRRATDNFSEVNILGTGSFGSVYKGTMSDGQIVAVKVLDLEVGGALNSFDTECEVLRNVRHRNLVKVITSCSNLDFKALVLEYMPNGSLDKLLYCRNHSLDLLRRMNIMIDVAVAVEYLHHGYSEPIVHCDLKPSNVLLDDNMVAHVSDFGIAKILAEYKSTTQTTTLGTMGYIAPEFGSEGRVSTKGDVFSYGIMLMETFTSKNPTDGMFVGVSSLRQWVNSVFPNHVMEVVDATFFLSEQKSTTKNTQCLQHSLSSIMELALQCTKDSPDERLTMIDVVAKLTKIKKEFLHSTTP